jgi:hypothetical protein
MIDESQELSINEVREFLESRWWRWLEAEYRSELLQLNRDLRELEDIKLYRAQGAAVKMEQMIDFPRSYLASLEADKMEGGED